MVRKIGISTFDLQKRYGDTKALDIAKEIGADAVDFCLDWNDYRRENSLYSKGEEAVAEYYQTVRSHADEIGIEICQTHGSSKGFKNIKEEDDAQVKNAQLDCLATSVLRAPVCIEHNTGNLPFGVEPDPKLMHSLSFDMYTRMLEHAKRYNVKIACETFGNCGPLGCCDFFGYVKEFLIAYNRVKAVGNNADYFTVCVDTGHTNTASRYDGNPTPADFIRMCGRDVTVLHLHDNDTLSDQHKMPLTGTIDWNDLFDALDEIHYEGVYNLELSLVRHFGKDFLIEEAEFAVKVMRNFLKDRYGQSS